MLVLAIDSSSEVLRLGIADDDGIIASFDGKEERNHSEKIIPEIDRLLIKSNIDPKQIDALAVPKGPGSFTGLRVGIAAALGLAQSWRVEVLTAPTMKLERQFALRHNPDPVIVIHCRGEEFYYTTDFDSGINIAGALALIGEFSGRYFCGAGAARLAKFAHGRGIELRLTAPVTYSGGDLAMIFASGVARAEQLDPANLDINYLLRSQPEERKYPEASVEIGDMTEGDLDEILAIERSSFTDPWDRKSFQTDISNEFAVTLSARAGGKCVGYLSCIALDDYGYIANIAVGKEFRSRGIGRALLDELKRRLRTADVSLMVLDVRVSNEAALRFYREYGFIVLTRRKGFYSNPPEDSFTMQFNAGM